MLRIPPRFSLAAAVALALLSAPAASSAAAQSRFDLRQVEWHLAPQADGESTAMEMRLDPLFERERLVLKIPLWRPGAYRYTNFQDRIHNLRVVDQDGKERRLQELTTHSWEVECRGATRLVVRYDLNTTNEADEGATPALLLRGPMTFLYTDDSLELPHRLSMDLPAGWDFASGHRADPSQAGAFYSPNYDVFVDCPIALGGLERHTFVSHGKEIEWVLFGRTPSEVQFSRSDWSRKLRAMAEVCHDLFGDYPFERYTFLFLMNGIGGISGLEHLNSTSILANHRAVKSGQMIEPLESVTAHEFFHLWNVKRIRPTQLGPFDYAQDVRTKDLWWLEGVTSYYNDVIVQRAGLRAEGWFWESQSQNFRGMRNTSGYGVTSPERSSWTTWDPDRSASISYYDQGQALGLLLDLKIRLETGNRRSLDDVLAFLARWVDYPGVGYRPGDLQRAVRAISGWDCSAFFERHVEGLQEPPFREILPQGGLKLVWLDSDDAYLGMSFVEGLELRVRNDAPAANAGMQEGDRLVSIDGVRVADQDAARDALKGIAVGQSVKLRVRRGGSTRDFEVEASTRGRLTFRIEVSADASAEQRAILEGILTGTPDSV